MLTPTVAGPLGEIRAASAAGGGTALTDAAGLVQLPKGTRHLVLNPRNFSTAVVVQFALNPYLIVLKTADSLATATEYSDEAQDGSTGTDVTLSSLGTLAQGDYLLVGSHVPFRGLSADVDAANGTASVLTVHYWDGDSWADISATDGTDNAGASVGQDGAITWTIPSDWATAKLKDAITTAGAGVPFRNDSGLYWVRLSWSAALDSSTTLNSLLALNRSTAYAELTTGQLFEEMVDRGPGGVACVEAKTNAGTANLIVNCATVYGSRFP